MNFLEGVGNVCNTVAFCEVWFGSLYLHYYFPNVLKYFQNLYLKNFKTKPSFQYFYSSV